MNIAAKTGIITALVLIISGIDTADGKKLNSGQKEAKMKTAITSGQSNINLTDENEDLSLFPLTKAIMTEL